MTSYNTYIDHTLLKPDATASQVEQLCQEALAHQFASVCVNPCFVPLCARLLQGSAVKVCTVVGFPLGACTTVAKVFETTDAVKNGAQEIDMVINLCHVKSGDFTALRQEVAAIVAAAAPAKVKVILETCLLTDAEKVAVCKQIADTGIAFVKTSTGFSTGGATVHDVALMRQAVGKDVGVKASGGIRDKATAQAMVEAGATRLGTSAGVAIATAQL